MCGQAWCHTRRRAWIRIRGRVSSRIRGRTWSRDRDRTRVQIGGHVCGRAWGQIGGQTRGWASDRIGSQLCGWVWGPFVIPHYHNKAIISPSLTCLNRGKRLNVKYSITLRYHIWYSNIKKYWYRNWPLQQTKIKSLRLPKTGICK